MPNRTDYLKEICKVVSETFDLSIFFVKPTGEISFEIIDNRIINPLYQNEKQNLFALLNFEPDKQYYFPVIRKTYFYENYILISATHDNLFEGTLIIGPSLPYVLFEQKINGLINDFHIFAQREQVMHYYHSTPVIPNEKLLRVSVMAFFLITQKLISVETVTKENLKLGQLGETNDHKPFISTKREQPEAAHHDPLLEKKLLSIIKEGRLEELKNFTKMEEESTGVLSKSSYIRSKKNIAIAGITLATRASIDGGLHPEMAFSLSDGYIQRLEDLKTIKEIDQLQGEAFFTFTERVHHVKEDRFSKTISTCKNYIYTNRYEKISHDDVANQVELSHSYLSILFKKEVGISVSEYIQQVKIEEAKNLIEYTHTPLSEIGSLLNFSDQSYFTKVFKKHTGITPKQYKEKYHLLEQ
ncbi:helix-turn-helix domain-containing protein [Neobacillus niacini]|uniref:helix-turn-helix domain-containing protein n=1 Tax=Neobacillus niacini TaxID=86668 RepID=UPI002FFDC3F1